MAARYKRKDTNLGCKFGGYSLNVKTYELMVQIRWLFVAYENACFAGYTKNRLALGFLNT